MIVEPLSATHVFAAVYEYSNDLANAQLDNCIPQEATSYANSRLNILLKGVQSSIEYYGLTKANLTNVKLGDPYFIYSVNSIGNQEPIYYYPVVKDDKIILTLSVFYSDNSWNASIQNSYVDELESIDYLDNDNIIFYEDENGTYAETDNDINVLGKANVESEKTLYEKRFNNYNFKEKRQAIINTYSPDESYKSEEQSLKSDDYSNLDGTGFSIETYYEIQLNTENRLVKQGSLGICWAASVATTVRYIKDNSKLTAKQVCDKINHKYNGGSMQDRQDALAAYGIYYNYLIEEQMSFAKVQTNIRNEKPILISARTPSQTYGHAMTIIGYSTYGGVKLITMYNSGSDSIQTVEYLTSGTKFSYNNDVYVWKRSLYYFK